VAVRKGHQLFVPFLGAVDSEERDVCLRAILLEQLSRTNARALRSIEVCAPLGDSALLPDARPRELTAALLVLDAAARPRAYADLDAGAHAQPASAI
jgi:hypothetical protein